MKKLMALASAALLTLAMAAPVAAAPSENADCHAQIKAAISDLVVEFDLAKNGSTKAVADLLGISVKEYQALLKECRVD